MSSAQRTQAPTDRQQDRGRLPGRGQLREIAASEGEPPLGIPDSREAQEMRTGNLPKPVRGIQLTEERYRALTEITAVFLEVASPCSLATHRKVSSRCFRGAPSRPGTLGSGVGKCPPLARNRYGPVTSPGRQACIPSPVKRKELCVSARLTDEQAPLPLLLLR